MKRFIAFAICVATVLAFRAPSIAQQVDNATADAAVNAFIKSPAWSKCGSGDSSLDGLIKAIPCVAKTDMNTARNFMDYLNSFAGGQQRMALARQISHGDGMQEASLEGRWDGELSNATILVREMGQKQIVATIINYPNAPVRLTQCGERHELDDPQWQITASWLPSKTALTAVKIRIETQDAFSSTLQTDYLSPTGDYQPNIEANDSWTVGDMHMPPEANVSKVRCSIVAAALVNGQIWNAPSRPLKKPVR